MWNTNISQFCPTFVERTEFTNIHLNVIHLFLPCRRPLTKEAPDRFRSFRLRFVVGKLAVVRNRITLGNKAYHANQFLFKSRLDSKKLKIKLYWSIIRPTVTYGCETCVLKGTAVPSCSW